MAGCPPFQYMTKRPHSLAIGGKDMSRILLRVATCALAMATAVAAAPGIAQAAPANTSVPCNAGTLASDIAGAASGATLGLAAHCTYTLTAALPTVSQNLTIKGNAATLERSRSRSCRSPAARCR
jgi:hypothetical protein